MRRILLIAGLAASATAASAQVASPGGVGGSPFGEGLAGRITGFGDLPATSGPAANTGSAVGGPITTQQIGANPFSGSSFRPAGLILSPSTNMPSGGATVSTLAANGSANGSGAGSPPVSTPVARGMTIFAGGVGPRRLGVK